MAQPVYSVQLFSSGGAVGTVMGPTVPAGFVWVVRTVTFRCQGVEPSVQGPLVLYWGGSIPIAGWTSEELYGQLIVTWDGHHVVPTGQQLSAVINPPGSAAFNVSGYELTLP